MYTKFVYSRDSRVLIKIDAVSKQVTKICEHKFGQVMIAKKLADGGTYNFRSYSAVVE